MLYKLFDRTYVIKYLTSLSLTQTWKLKEFTTTNGNQQTEGLVITAGHLKQNYLSLNDLWDKKYRPPILRATMPKCRFIALTRFMRFDNKETRTARRAADKLASIRDLFNEINTLLLRYYTPSEYLTVDEQLVPFKGRCPFRQYIPSKPDKYGMKIFWIFDAKSFYPLKAKPSLGKEGNAPQQNLDLKVVLELITLFTDSGKNITMDNYFTDMVLATTFLQNGLTLIGTVRKNKPFIPPSFLPSRSREKKSSIFAFQQKSTLVSYVPKKNKAVLLLSTMHNNISVTDDDEKKPEINIFYNETKGGVDCLDMLVHN